MAKYPPEERQIVVSGASVKVMRSYDYCHFEIQLSTICEDGLLDKQINELRKSAMRLADKAVEQYKIARKAAEAILQEKHGYARLAYDVERIMKDVPKAEWTPEHKAKMKALEDFEFHSQFDYEDDCDEWWDG